MGTHRERTTIAEKIEAYFDGYRRIPDGGDPDFLAMEAISLQDLADAHEDWPEAPGDDEDDGHAPTSETRRLA